MDRRITGSGIMGRNIRSQVRRTALVQGTPMGMAGVRITCNSHKVPSSSRVGGPMVAGNRTVLMIVIGQVGKAMALMANKVTSNSNRPPVGGAVHMRLLKPQIIVPS